jgi:hypothetical protein
MSELKFYKVEKGCYATDDGRWAVVNDGYGYVSQAERDGDGLLAGVTGNQWAAVFDPRGRLREDSGLGENLDWFDTKREAIAYCRDSARRWK